MKHVALLLLAPTLLAAQSPVDAVARPISLDEAVRLAQRNAPQAVQARGQLRTSRAGVRSSYSAFLPNVNLSMGSAWQQGQRIGPQGNLIDFTGPPKSYSDGVTLSMELFDGGRRFFDLRSARAEVGAADANDVLQQYQVSLNVKQQYFNVLAAREAEEAAKAELEQAEQQLRVAAARVSAGAATKSDSLRSVVLVGNARLALLTARNNLQVASASLTRLVATPFPVTAAPDSSLDAPVAAPDSIALLQLAEDGPAVRQARAQLRAASATAKAARTPYLPTISASFNRGGSGFDSRFGFDGTYAYANSFRLSASYPLFNQLQREQQVVRANVAEDVAEAMLRDARLRARQELTQYLGLLRTAQQRIEIQQVTVAAAEEDLRVQQQRYTLGASTLLDVLTSQSQLNQARSGLIAARYDYRVARAQLEALVGRDLEIAPAGAPE